MKVLLSLFSLFLLLSSCKRTPAHQPMEVDPIRLSMDKYADSLVKDPLIHGLSIGVYKDGKEYLAHYGELDPGKGNTPSNETIYEIASVSKTFTGTLVAKAVMEGLLDLDDDIRTHMKGDYPNLEYQGHPIRVRHLLTHRAELPKFLPMEINVMFDTIDETLADRVFQLENAYSREAFFEDLKRIRLDTVPGTRYSYSNADTELMAHILENVYQKDFEGLLQTYITHPYKMRSVKVVLSENEKKYLPNGYGIGNLKTPYMTHRLWGAGGAMKSTLPDLVHYMKFQLDIQNELVNKSHEVLYEDQYVQTAYYWPVKKDSNDAIYYSHHGGAYGMQNWFFVFPEYNMGLSIITNQSDLDTAGKLYETAQKILEDIPGLPENMIKLY
ncbi:MAG: serine hydrolase domain-containing protein [Bacteroidota bacterium]